MAKIVSKVRKAPKEFRVPKELMVSFQSDIRFVPKDFAPNGYIIFDRAMLTSILRSKDDKVRSNLAAQIDKLGAAGGELVIVGK